jgi:hypothetical protein
MRNSRVSLLPGSCSTLDANVPNERGAGVWADAHAVTTSVAAITGSERLNVKIG